MSSLSKKLVFAGAMLLLLLVLVLPGRAHDYQQAEQQSRVQATQLSHYFSSELARFKTILP